MVIDPNLYSLQIALALDSAAANAALASFTQSIVGVESQVSEAAQKSLASITNISKTADESLSGVISRTTELDTSAIETNKAFIKIQDTIKDTFDTNEEQLENIEEEIKQIKKMFDVYTDIEETIRNQLDVNEQFLKTVNDTTGAIKKKNVGHDKQLGLLNREGDSANDLYLSFIAMRDIVYDILNALRWVVMTTEKFINYLADVTKLQEEFITNNYRLYGSMQGLSNEVRSIAAEYGLLQEEATAAYKALVNVRAPRDEIRKLAGNIAMLNRVTGVSVSTWADYSRKLRGFGIDANESIKSMSRMSDMMRKLGLTTQDMQRILDDTGLSAVEINSIFADPRAFKQMTEMKMMLAGWGQQAGLTAGQIAGIGDQMNHVIKDFTYESARLQQLTGIAVTSVDQIPEALAVAATRIDDIVANIDDPRLREAYIREYAKAYGFVSVEAYKAYSEIAKLQKIKGDLPFADALQEYNDTLKDSYHGTEGFYRLLGEIRTQFNNLLAPIMELVADALIPFLQVVLWVLKSLVQLTTTINRSVRAIGSFIETYVPFGKQLLWGARVLGIIVVGAIVLFVGAIMLAVTALASLLAFLVAIPGGFSVMSGLISNIGNLIINISGMIGRAIGSAIAGVGNAIRSVMLPILALGAAFMMVGIGAYFFAGSVKIIAEVGWRAIPAMIGMIAAIGILGLVLVGLGMLIQGPVMLGVIVLGAAILAIGVSAWLVASSISMIVDAIIRLIKVTEKFSTEHLVTLGSNLLLASTMVYQASALLLVAGFTLIAASGAIAIGSASLSASLIALAASGGVMVATALALHIGLSALQSSTTKLTNLGNSMSLIATSADMLATSMSKLEDIQFSGLDAAVGRLSAAVIEFKTPIEELAYAMGDLHSTLITFDSDLEFISKIDNLTSKLERRSQGMSTGRFGDQVDVDADSVRTVQLMTNGEYSLDDDNNIAPLLTEQNEILRNMLTAIVDNGGSDKSDKQSLLNILQRLSSQSNSPLTSSLGDWEH